MLAFTFLLQSLRMLRFLILVGYVSFPASQLLTNSENILRGSASKLLGESYSATRPCSSTSTFVESMIVFKRWAIVKHVQSENSTRMLVWMSASVSTSTAAVASSMMITRAP